MFYLLTLIPNYLELLCFKGHVLNPNIEYKGQEFIKLVKTIIAAPTSNTIPQVPVTVFVKYSATNTIAKIILIILSGLPTFVFIFLFFYLD